MSGEVIFVDDENLLWKGLEKVGSPDRWEPSKTYQTGDLVVPRVIQAGQENIMFQCIGYIGRASPTAPVFSLGVNTLVDDNNIEWKTRLPTDDPEALKKNEFYFITETVTLV